jgi:GNAT superfamily N-acetyltransferase
MCELQKPAVTLRHITPADDALLLELYGSTRADELALLPWSDEQKQQFIAMQLAAQQDYYSQKYPDGQHDVIVYDGRAVGRLYVARLADEIRIVDLIVLPTERNAGIGSQLVKQLLEEARAAGKRVRIFVESFNPSLKLFERMGFVAVEESGIHLLLEWTPGT